MRHHAHRLTEDGLEMHYQVPLHDSQPASHRTARVDIGPHDARPCMPTRVTLRQVNHAAHFLLTHGLLDRWTQKMS